MPDRDLITEPIPRLVRRVAIPASVGLFFHTMYNVTDTYYAGLLSTEALASLTLAFPAFFTIISFGSGLSVGATALIGTALGEGDKDEARRFAGQGLAVGVLLSFAVGLLGWVITPTLFRYMGADGDYLTLAVGYMRTLFAGTTLFMANYALNAVLNAKGDTKPYRNFLIGTFFLNVALDPWFMYGGLGLPAMGVRGVGLATVVAQATGTVYLGYHAALTGLISLWPRDLARLSARHLRELAEQGLPASLNSATIGIGIFVITHYASRFGHEAVAAYGVATRIEQIVLMATVGLNVATLSLIAQNRGAGRYDRATQAMNSALAHGAAVMLPGGVVLYFTCGLLARLFTDDEAVVQAAVSYLRIASAVLFAYVVLYVGTSAMQGLKKPMFAIWIGLFRQIIAPIAAFEFLAYGLGMGLNGVWLGIALVTWAAAGVAFFWSRRTMAREWRKYEEKKKAKGSASGGQGG